MKSLLLIGGTLGWTVGMGASYSRGNVLPVCLWHGCLGAYLTALLLRWWGRSWRSSLAQSLQEREKAESAVTPTVVTLPKVSKT